MPVSVLANAIRNHIGEPSTPAEQAILAVVHKCEAMRAESSLIGWAFADELEATICRTLKPAVPLADVPEFRRVLGM